MSSEKITMTATAVIIIDPLTFLIIDTMMPTQLKIHAVMKFKPLTYGYKIISGRQFNGNGNSILTV